MSFLKSAINQVGRDLGKVVSNQLFGDSHSAPHRIVGISSTKKTRIRREIKSEFEKAIDFQPGLRPSTLISKLAGCYTVLKNEISEALVDGYLDNSEAQVFFGMVSQFTKKAEDIDEILDLDRTKNEAEIAQLGKIADNLKTLIIESMELSIEGCKRCNEQFLERSNNIKVSGFGHFFGLTRHREKLKEAYSTHAALELKRIEVYKEVIEQMK